VREVAGDMTLVEVLERVQAHRQARHTDTA
jgi:hypothetical protein